jgi:uncharacterized protein (TIGR03437 family)
MRTIWLAALAAAAALAQSQGIITTVVGTGNPAFSGDGGPAARAELAMATGDGELEEYAHIAFDAQGNLYIPDQFNNRVRRVDRNGIITTVAGTGEYAFSGHNVPATGAALANPTAVLADAAGNLYICDQHNNRVRRISPDGIITTFAGNGDHGWSGNGAPAMQAALDFPGGLARDPAGNIYIADTHNNQIRRVAPNGIITAYAGTGEHGYGGDGGSALRAVLDWPAGLAFDPQGNLYIADQHNNCIRRVSPAGVITTIAGRGPNDWGYAGDGGPAVNALLDYPADVAFDAQGNLFIADQANSRIRKVDRNGIITTVVGNGTPGFAGDGGPPLLAMLDYPSGITFDAEGNLYINDHYNNRIRKVVFNPPALAWSTSTLSFAATAGGAAPPAQTLTLSNPGAGSLSFSMLTDQPWLSVSPQNGTLGTSPVTVTVAVRLASLAAGEYTGQITVQAPGAANSPQRVRVSLTMRAVAAPPPAFTAAGVVHAATFASGPIAPGQILSIFGSNLGPVEGVGLLLDTATGRLATNRAGVTVLFNDVPGPLFFVRQDQINVQAPYELAGQAAVRIVVRNVDTAGAPVAVPLAPAVPGVFTVSQGRGQAALLNQDFTPNSAANPASRGSAVQIFLTGQGATNPPAATGQLPQAPFPVPLLPVTVTIGGRSAQTLFVGLAPGLVGLLQVNAVVPEDVAPGQAPLQVSVGSTPSQTGVTLAVN